MKHLLIALTSIIALAATAQPSFAELGTEARISDARAIVDLYEHRYAPAPWKHKLHGTDVVELGTQFLNRVQNDMTDEEFYEEVGRYLAGFHDAHVSMYIPSTYVATLGFDVDEVEGHTVITHVYRNILSTEAFPYERGDQLIAIDGVPVEHIRAELGEISTTGSVASDARLNSMNLTWRSQMIFPRIPEGISTVTIKPRNSGKETTVNLTWTTTGMPLAPTDSAPSLNKSISKSPLPESPLERVRKMYTDRGRRRGMTEWLPEGPAFPVWQSFERVESAPLFAGTATIGKKRIAFIKINSFLDADNKQAAVFQFLGSQLPLWDESTDALIIDLTENGGGWICYSETIASFLISEPIEGLKFQIKPTRAWSVDFEMELEWTTDEADRALLREIIEKIRAGLASGAELTEPLPICKPDGKIPTAVDRGLTKKAYTKPIIILVNELTASAGEMFPALLQDAGRATVFGTRTMGAGGNIMYVGPIGKSDITISITESLGVRNKDVIAPNGMATRYVENVGVIPEVEYDVTLEDFLSGYKNYLSALENAVLGGTTQ